MEENRKEPSPQAPAKPTLERIIQDGFRLITDYRGEKIYGKGYERILYDPQTDRISLTYSVPVDFGDPGRFTSG